MSHTPTPELQAFYLAQAEYLAFKATHETNPSAYWDQLTKQAHIRMEYRAALAKVKS